MDDYTKKNLEWVDKRFKLTDKKGVYRAHQSIYGFYKHRSRDSAHANMITNKILNTLATIKFNTFLDAGSAEGYKAHLVKKFLDAEVHCSDLSTEACKRGKEIFGIDGTPGDLQDLPFEDD